MRLQLRSQRRSVQFRSLFRPEGLRGAALDEQPLGRIKRRQRFVTCGQLAQCRPDAEQFTDEIVQMRRQIDQQQALAASGDHHIRLCPRRQQPRGQIAVCFPQPLGEAAVSFSNPAFS